MRNLPLHQWITPVLCTLAFVGSAAQIPLQSPKTHGGLTAYAFSPDGRRVAGGSGQVSATSAGTVLWQGGGEVLLWDATTGRLQATLGTHQATVTSVAFSRDGSALLSASRENGTVKLWDAESARLRHTVKVAEPLVASAPPRAGTLTAVAPKGRYFAAVGASPGKVGQMEVATSATLTVWDGTSGQPAWKVADSGVDAIEFSPDGTVLVAFCQDLNWRPEGDGAIAIPSNQRLIGWETSTGKVRFTAPMPRRGSGLLLFPAKGDRVLLLGGSQSGWFDVATGLKLRDQAVQPSFKFASAAIDPAGERLVGVESGGSKVLEVNLADGKATPLAQFQSFPQRVWNAAVAPDLRRIAATRNNQPALLDW